MERKSYLDVAKGIALLLVVWGHAGMRVPGLGTAIIQFHMPLFFIVSGYLFKNSQNKIGNKILKKAKRLLVPYFVFSLIYLLLDTAKDLMTHQSLDIKEVMSLLFYWDGNVVRMGTPMWFLPVLFFTDVIYTLLKRYAGKYAVMVCVILAVFAFIWMPVFPFGLRISCIGVYFFMIGDYSKKLIGRFEGRRWLCLVVGIVLLTAEYMLAQMNPGVNLYRYSFGKSWICYIFLAIIGAFGVIFVGGGITKSKWLEWISRQSLFILATHFIILMIINAIGGKLGVEYVNGVLITVLCFLTEYLVIAIIKKFKSLNALSGALGIV